MEWVAISIPLKFNTTYKRENNVTFEEIWKKIP